LKLVLANAADHELYNELPRPQRFFYQTPYHHICLTPISCICPTLDIRSIEHVIETENGFFRAGSHYRRLISTTGCSIVRAAQRYLIQTGNSNSPPGEVVVLA